MAGRQVQCPDCQRLVDVPTTNELAELSEDGTFRMDAPVDRDSGHFEKMRRVYGKDKVDENGAEIDLRQTRDELAAAGTEDDILAFEHQPTAPKYDPETGELIRPLDIVDDPTIAPHPSQLPMATNTLNYASPELQAGLPYSPLARLLSPINLAAMFFVLFFQLFFYLAAIFAVPHRRRDIFPRTGPHRPLRERGRGNRHRRAGRASAIPAAFQFRRRHLASIRACLPGLDDLLWPRHHIGDRSGSVTVGRSRARLFPSDRLGHRRADLFPRRGSDHDHQRLDHEPAPGSRHGGDRPHRAPIRIAGDPLCGGTYLLLAGHVDRPHSGDFVCGDAEACHQHLLRSVPDCDC